MLALDYGSDAAGLPYLTLRFDAAPSLPVPVPNDHPDVALEAGLALVEATLGYSLPKGFRSDWPAFAVYAPGSDEVVAGG